MSTAIVGSNGLYVDIGIYIYRYKKDRHMDIDIEIDIDTWHHFKTEAFYKIKIECEYIYQFIIVPDNLHSIALSVR